MNLPSSFAPSPFGFAGNTLDRLGEREEPLDVPSLMREQGSLFYLFLGNDILVRSNAPFHVHFSYDDFKNLGGKPDECFLLGRTQEGHNVFTALVADSGSYEASDLRDMVRSGILIDDTIGATAQARSLVQWHRRHSFCANCGQKTHVMKAGSSRQCAACETQHFPRTDPVVIMLITDGERCLLGRGPQFPDGMVSCLAGFVEVGETIEEAVRRETFEESGIKVGAVRYHASQPWPFVSSLMIGCLAEATSTDIVTDDELEFCGWFTRDEARVLLGKRESRHEGDYWSPPPATIAHQLLKAFVNAG